MIELILIATALSFPRINGENTGDCADGRCVVLHHESSSFRAARDACRERAGDLLTVTTEKTATLLARVLNGASGSFWIGLRRTSVDECTDSGLKGFTWVTGAQKSDYLNWESDRADCAPLCVSVERDLNWRGKPCEEVNDGYLCEYENSRYCQPLKSNEGVFYSTPFGFLSKSTLQEAPEYSNATALPLRTKHICVESSWLQAPWSCEVFNGGCDFRCVSEAQKHSCICELGFVLDDNMVSCSLWDDKPGFVLKSSSDAKPSDTLKCKPGFYPVSGVCVDVDECEVAPCEHLCTNTEGSYECECFEGFQRSSEDMQRCEMHCSELTCLAECDPNNPTQCNCPFGFILENDADCVDIDECDSAHDCDQLCMNTPGSYKCSCSEGFVLLDDGGCDREDVDGSGNTDIFPPTLSPMNTQMSLSAGSLLGIMICIVVCLVLLVCFTHCIRRRLRKMHQYDMHKGHEEIYDFQQVIVDDTNIPQTLSNRN